MSGLLWVLGQDWWQGIAGIAQMAAGLLAMRTISQARKALKQADEERKLSVEPDWDSKGCRAYAPSKDSSLSTVEIVLINSGFGPARNPTVQFTAHNDYEPIPGSVRCYGQLARKLILPQSNLLVYLDWYRDKPLDGTITVGCTTRLGGKQSTRFDLQTSHKPGTHDGCAVYRLPDETKGHGRWRWPWQRRGGE